MEQLSNIDILVGSMGLVVLGMFVSMGFEAMVDRKISRIRLNIPNLSQDKNCSCSLEDDRTTNKKSKNSKKSSNKKKSK
jgi:hypothetical protein